MAVKEQEVTKTELVLDSLEVKNFRAFKHLTIEKLGRVNLITGKNNVGKTALLEALWLYATNGSSEIIRRLLKRRNEIASALRSPARDSEYAKERRDGILALEAIISLFHGDRLPLEGLESIVIGRAGNPRLSIDLEWLVEIDTDEPDSPPVLSPVDYVEAEEYDAQPYLAVRNSGRIRRTKVERFNSPILILPSQKDTPCNALWTLTLSSSRSERLWDDVIAKDLESEVMDAMRTVLPEISKVVYKADAISRVRRPYLRLAGNLDSVPLARFGDGIQRMFDISLALVNAADGFLLIDEIENGIHYSILPSLWQFIFAIAGQLNVQVFATSHSWDSISAFARAAHEDVAPNTGLLIRLQSKRSNIVATVLDEEDLDVITRGGIEVR